MLYTYRKLGCWTWSDKHALIHRCFLNLSYQKVVNKETTLTSWFQWENHLVYLFLTFSPRTLLPRAGDESPTLAFHLFHQWCQEVARHLQTNSSGGLSYHFVLSHFDPVLEKEWTVHRVLKNEVKNWLNKMMMMTIIIVTILLMLIRMIIIIILLLIIIIILTITMIMIIMLRPQYTTVYWKNTNLVNLNSLNRDISKASPFDVWRMMTRKPFGIFHAAWKNGPTNLTWECWAKWIRNGS